MIYNLTSANVAVFPVAKERTQGIAETRLLTEHNLSGIIRQLLPNSNPGFITSTTEDSGNFNVKFNLYGYQFDIDVTKSWLANTNIGEITNGSLYAFIVLDKTIDEIVGQDNNSSYQGLHLTADVDDINKYTLTANQEIVYIKILNITNGTLSAISNASFLGQIIGGIDGKYK